MSFLAFFLVDNLLYFYLDCDSIDDYMHSYHFSVKSCHTERHTSADFKVNAELVNTLLGDKRSLIIISKPLEIIKTLLSQALYINTMCSFNTLYAPLFHTQVQVNMHFNTKVLFTIKTCCQVTR